MRPINLATIAHGACNIAIASAQAKSSGQASSLAALIYAEMRRQLKEKSVDLVLADPEPEHGIEAAFRPHLRALIIGTLASAETSLKDADLPPRFHQKVERVRNKLSDDHFDAAVISELFNEIMYDLIAELSEPMFLHVKPERRHLYEQKEPPFGLEVDAAFPASARDISAAARCLALDEWTACVFHLMRALESPLHRLAERMAVSFPSPVDLENWKNIIDKVESAVNEKVRQQGQAKKSHERNDELKQLAEIAILFRHFKNAWRNDAAHGRQSFDEREAQQVYDGVRNFMQLMAVFV